MVTGTLKTTYRGFSLFETEDDDKLPYADAAFSLARGLLLELGAIVLPLNYACESTLLCISLFLIHEGIQ